jgi:hypothetical protein
MYNIQIEENGTVEEGCVGEMGKHDGKIPVQRK